MASNTFTSINWKQDSSVLGFIEDLVKDRESRIASADWQAEVNIAWYRGHQLLRRNSRSGVLETQSNPNKRVRLTYNMMRGLVDGFAAKMALDNIQLRCEPATDDMADFDSAQVRTKLLQYYQEMFDGPGDISGVGGLSDEIDQYAILTGEAYGKVVWDADKGPSIGEYGAEDFKMSEEDYQKEFGKEIEDLRKGDISVTNIPLFNLHWGPAGVSFDEAEYVLEVYERSVAAVMERYGLKADDVSVENDKAIRIWRAGQTGASGSMESERSDDIVLVKELWVKPNKAIKGLERGRHCVAVSNKLQVNIKNPYKHQAIPIVRYPLMTVPGEPRGDTFVTDMIPVQASINRTVSQMAENRELMANPVWLARLGVIADISEWTSQAGGIRTYEGGEKPSLEQGAAMPNAVMMQLANDLKFLQDIVGLRDVSQGKNPPGVRSGRGIALLKESDDERLGRMVKRRRNFWRRVGELILATLEQYATEDRKIRICGEESGSETITYTGEMLKGDGDEESGFGRFDVRVEARGMPRSYSAKLEQLDRALERQALNPAEIPEDREIVLDILELGKSRQPLSTRRRAREMQHVRNRKMAEGEDVRPDIREDLETMLKELSLFRHQPFFPDLADDVKQRFNQYEDEATALMALRPIQREQVIQQALIQAGVLPPQGQAGPPQPGLTANPPNG